MKSEKIWGAYSMLLLLASPQVALSDTAVFDGKCSAKKGEENLTLKCCHVEQVATAKWVRTDNWTFSNSTTHPNNQCSNPNDNDDVDLAGHDITANDGLKGNTLIGHGSLFFPGGSLVSANETVHHGLIDISSPSRIQFFEDKHFTTKGRIINRGEIWLQKYNTLVNDNALVNFDNGTLRGWSGSAEVINNGNWEFYNDTGNKLYMLEGPLVFNNNDKVTISGDNSSPIRFTKTTFNNNQDSKLEITKGLLSLSGGSNLGRTEGSRVDIAEGSVFEIGAGQYEINNSTFIGKGLLDIIGKFNYVTMNGSNWFENVSIRTSRGSVTLNDQNTFTNLLLSSGTILAHESTTTTIERKFDWFGGSLLAEGKKDLVIESDAELNIGSGISPLNGVLGMAIKNDGVITWQHAILETPYSTANWPFIFNKENGTILLNNGAMVINEPTIFSKNRPQITNKGLILKDFGGVADLMANIRNGGEFNIKDGTVKVRDYWDEDKQTKLICGGPDPVADTNKASLNVSGLLTLRGEFERFPNCSIVAEQVDLGGTLRVKMPDDYTVDLNDEILLIASQNTTGTFDKIDVPFVGENIVLVPVISEQNVILKPMEIESIYIPDSFEFEEGSTNPVPIIATLVNGNQFNISDLSKITIDGEAIAELDGQGYLRTNYIPGSTTITIFLMGTTYQSTLTVSCEDSDDDGVCDSGDNCPSVTNFDQADNDDDSIGNVCDNCMNTFNPEQLNDDGDTAGNQCDKCMGANDQLDSNSDGVPDACECEYFSITDEINVCL